VSAPLPDSSRPSSAQDIAGLTERLFRHEAGKLVSVLTGIFGIERLQLAEDVVQEALVRALQTWPYHGVPKNPAAWLMQTARNLALDVLRREKNFHAKQTDIVTTIELRMSDPGEANAPAFDDEITDQRLRLIFTCCHPILPPEAQTALALKTLGGLSPAEIAKAFLTSEAAVAKRLTRARASLQEAGVAFEIPAGADLPPRLDGVLQILYLLFNEGYKASHGDSLLRADLCEEAIRLAQLLASHPAGDQPRTHALLALMLLNAARFATRTDAQGRILRLEEQDRAAWNRALISQGIHHLRRASAGSELTEYHIQAGIAACHCTAPDAASTNWRFILSHYDQWVLLTDSPIVALNRAVAVAKIDGPAAGLAAVAAIPNRRQLDGYHLTHAVLGDFEVQRGDFRAAAAHFRRALDLAEARPEQDLITRRLRDCAAE
jgi:RNA polymerase sigma-70 factor (ECF subfamily)